MTLRFIFGLVSIVAGAVMTFDPVVGLNALTIVTIAYFLLDSLMEILIAFRLPPGAGGFWVVAVPILIGIKLIFTGIVVLAVSRASRVVIDKLK